MVQFNVCKKSDYIYWLYYFSKRLNCTILQQTYHIRAIIFSLEDAYFCGQYGRSLLTSMFRLLPRNKIIIILTANTFDSKMDVMTGCVLNADKLTCCIYLRVIGSVNESALGVQVHVQLFTIISCKLINTYFRKCTPVWYKNITWILFNCNDYYSFIILRRFYCNLWNSYLHSSIKFNASTPKLH